jgi:hypothetical protein
MATDTVLPTRDGALLDRPLSELLFPTRIENFISRRGLRTVRDLVAIEPDALLVEPNLGRKSVNDTAQVIRRFLGVTWEDAREGLSSDHVGLPRKTRDSVVPPSAPVVEGVHWTVVLRDALRSLSQRERLVLTQRSGLAGPIPTLAELGSSLGVTRERVRQLEASGLKHARRARWVTEVTRRLHDRLTRSVHDISEVEVDEFFDNVEENIEPFSFLVNEVLQGDLSVAIVEGFRVLTRLPAKRLVDRLRQARTLAPQIGFPIAWSDRYDALATALGCTENDSEDLRIFIDGEWLEEQGVTTGFGRRRSDEVIAFVRAAAGPVHRTAIEKKFGRGHMPDELVLIGPGLLTVPDRIPDWERWARRVPPVVRSIIEREGAQRQWTTAELMSFLEQEAQLPDWFNEYTLGSLLRSCTEVEYLKRNVVALPASGQDRLYLRDGLKQLLEREGRPIQESRARDATRRRGSTTGPWSCDQARLRR